MLVVTDVGWGHPDAVRLRAAQRADIAEMYGRDDSEPLGSAASEADIATFLVAYRDGVPVGCGGLRLLDDDVVEIKRMYVVPAARGDGTSVRLLRSLESWARDRALRALRLETGDRQAAAIRFYEREGFVRIPPFGPYVGSDLSLCYERTLL